MSVMMKMVQMTNVKADVRKLPHNFVIIKFPEISLFAIENIESSIWIEQKDYANMI